MFLASDILKSISGLQTLKKKICFDHDNTEERDLQLDKYMRISTSNGLHVLENYIHTCTLFKIFNPSKTVRSQDEKRNQKSAKTEL